MHLLCILIKLPTHHANIEYFIQFRLIQAIFQKLVVCVKMTFLRYRPTPRDHKNNVVHVSKCKGRSCESMK